MSKETSMSKVIDNQKNLQRQIRELEDTNQIDWKVSDRLLEMSDDLISMAQEMQGVLNKICSSN